MTNFQIAQSIATVSNMPFTALFAERTVAMLERGIPAEDLVLAVGGNVEALHLNTLNTEIQLVRLDGYSPSSVTMTYVRKTATQIVLVSRYGTQYRFRVRDGKAVGAGDWEMISAKDLAIICAL